MILILNYLSFFFFLLISLTFNTSSDQEREYSALVKAFMEKLQHLEEDFQR